MERVSPLAMDWRRTKNGFLSRSLTQNLFYHGLRSTVTFGAIFGATILTFGDGDLARSSIDLAANGNTAAALNEMLRYVSSGLLECHRATSDFFDIAKDLARTHWQEFLQDPTHPFKVMSAFFTSLPGGDAVQQWANWAGQGIGERIGGKGSLLEKYSGDAISFLATTIVPMAVTWMAAKKGFKALSACANAAASAFAAVNDGIDRARRWLRGIPEPERPAIYDPFRDGIPDGLTGDPEKQHDLHEGLTKAFQEASMKKHVALGMADTLMSHFIALQEADTGLRARISEQDARLRKQDNQIEDQQSRLDAQGDLIASLHREIARIREDVSAQAARIDPEDHGLSQ